MPEKAPSGVHWRLKNELSLQISFEASLFSRFVSKMVSISDTEYSISYHNLVLYAPFLIAVNPFLELTTFFSRNPQLCKKQPPPIL